MSGQVDRAFWRGKRVLVTGHTGFKGSWLCLTLSELGAKVFGLALAPEEPSLFAQARVGDSLSREHYCDIADFEAVAQFVDLVQPEIVMHFAAHALYRQCHREPRRAFLTNVMGAANVMDAVRQSGSVAIVLTATSDKVYFNTDKRRQPFREGDRLGGVSPYGASKAAEELVVACWRTSYLVDAGIASVVCRAGNVVGGGDWGKDRLIPDIVRSVLAKETLSVRYPSAVRPWQFVLDALRGYMMLVEHSATMKCLAIDPEDAAWNFGPSFEAEEITVADICGWVDVYWKGRFRWRVERDAEGIAESYYLALDPSKAMRELGWQPQIAPEAAVRKTLDWYSAHLAGEDARALCVQQIREHFDLRA